MSFFKIILWQKTLKLAELFLVALQVFLYQGTRQWFLKDFYIFFYSFTKEWKQILRNSFVLILVI